MFGGKTPFHLKNMPFCGTLPKLTLGYKYFCNNYFSIYTFHKCRLHEIPIYGATRKDQEAARD